MKVDFLESDSIQEIKNCAAQNAVPIVRDEGLEFILNFIEKNGAKRILEIGTGIGYSAIMFAKCAADISVFTIESDAERYEQAKKNIANENLSQRVTCFFGDALEFDFAERFDLIFIDGPKAQYIKFFEKFKNNLAQGGAILSDNLFFHGMVQDLSLTHNYSTKKLVKKIRKYIEFLKANEEFETQFFEQGDGISVSVWKN
ncbi:MAG: O-methyltransferase [Treponema sp.]|nr:O-methyltransferase [Treponema sp.]